MKVDAAFEGTLARARALLAHSHAGRDDAVLLKRALDLLIETEERRRFGSKSSRSRAGGSTPKARWERRAVPLSEPGKAAPHSASASQWSTASRDSAKLREPMCGTGA